MNAAPSTKTDTTLTPRARFLAAAQGERVDRPPVWLMRQAGRYLPEYQRLRAEHDFVTCCTTPKLSHEISLQPWRRFHMDGVIIFTDILMPLAAAGLDFAVTEKIGPTLAPAIRSAADVARLRTPNAARDFAYLAETLSMLRASVGEHAAVIGFCGAPWTIATYMVSGGKAADQHAVKQWLLESHDTRSALFAWLEAMLADYLVLQARAGADVLQIFDSWAGLLTATEFSDHAGAATARIIARVRQVLGTACPPIIMFVQKNGHLLREIFATRADVISLDSDTNFNIAREQIQEPYALQGNLASSILQQGPVEKIIDATNAMCAAGGLEGFIANLGHGVHKETPIAHVAAFVETVKNFTPHSSA